ncbi:hypothetical protein AB9F26_19600 [Falsihalocynthiibacter sp. BN13B15]|uniref:hypothetical protein n=1 Tax=Falsihalocynthiibacter sp. BN13B15 TaxID=3240871 RepID=UPI00350FD295
MSTHTGFSKKLHKVAALKMSDWREVLNASKALFEARSVFTRLPAKSIIAHLQAREEMDAPNSKKPDDDASLRDLDVDASLMRLEWAISGAASVLF